MSASGSMFADRHGYLQDAGEVAASLRLPGLSQRRPQDRLAVPRHPPGVVPVMAADPAAAAGLYRHAVRCRRGVSREAPGGHDGPAIQLGAVWPVRGRRHPPRAVQAAERGRLAGRVRRRLGLRPTPGSRPRCRHG